MKLESAAKKLVTFVKTKGDWAYSRQQKASFSIKVKSSGELTTEIDEAIEQDFSEFVKKNFPDHGFVGEEFKELHREAEFTWYIDPIDGTRYYAANVPMWSVTASLIKSGKPIIGVLYQPACKQMYQAIEGRGAFVNGERLKIYPKNNQETTNVVWDFVKHEGVNDEGLILMNKLYSELVKTYYHVACLGNGSLSLAWLARGSYHLFLDPLRRPSKFVDIAAGLLIAQEAGARVVYKSMKNGKDKIYVGSHNAIKSLEQILVKYRLEDIS